MLCLNLKIKVRKSSYYYLTSLTIRNSAFYKLRSGAFYSYWILLLYDKKNVVVWITGFIPQRFKFSYIKLHFLYSSILKCQCNYNFTSKLHIIYQRGTQKEILKMKLHRRTVERNEYKSSLNFIEETTRYYSAPYKLEVKTSYE